ncbi:hypothetical protein [Paraburkholderia graminis]|uniref:hypothetical protein n=1 Tax=Paraburkholderia graminis TaxID=60548 RepID=UPI0038B81BA3
MKQDRTGKIDAWLALPGRRSRYLESSKGCGALRTDAGVIVRTLPLDQLSRACNGALDPCERSAARAAYEALVALMRCCCSADEADELAGICDRLRSRDASADDLARLVRVACRLCADVARDAIQAARAVFE